MRNSKELGIVDVDDKRKELYPWVTHFLCRSRGTKNVTVTSWEHNMAHGKIL